MPNTNSSLLEQALIRLSDTVESSIRNGEKYMEIISKAAENMSKAAENISKSTKAIEKATEEIKKTNNKIEGYIASEAAVIEKETNERFTQFAIADPFFKQFHIYNIRAAWSYLFKPDISKDPKKMVNKDYKNIDAITEFDGIFLVSPHEHSEQSFLDDTRITKVNTPRPKNNSTISNFKAFFVILEAKREIFFEWTKKLDRYKDFQMYISRATDIISDNQNKMFTRESQEKVKKFDLTNVSQDLYVFFTGEKFLVDEQFFISHFNPMAEQLYQSSPQITLGYIKLDGSRYGIFKYTDSGEFVRANNSKVNSLTTGTVTLSRQNKSDSQTGGKLKHSRKAK